ncbi:MAG: tellurite resistance TerB family protein [Albidovulum sp.]
MSLMGTLAKVAIGIVVAKSVGGMLNKGGGGAGRTGGTAGAGGSVGSDGRFGGPQSPGRKTGLEDIMGDVFKGAPSSTTTTRMPQEDPFGKPFDPVVANEPGASRGGGLGDLFEQLGGGAGRSGGTGQSGGLGDILGQLTRGGSGAPGGLGDLLGGLVAGAAGGRATGGQTKDFGDMLNDAFGKGGEPDLPPAPEHEAAAGLILRAMIQAAKSDGRIDAAEKKKLMSNLSDATPAEMEFVQAELRAPLDVAGLCRQVPAGLEAQIYGMSLMAIDLDSRVEAEYLHQLAGGLNLNKQVVNQIHAQIGVAPLYR